MGTPTLGGRGRSRPLSGLDFSIRGCDTFTHHVFSWALLTRVCSRLDNISPLPIIAQGIQELINQSIDAFLTMGAHGFYSLVLAHGIMEQIIIRKKLKKCFNTCRVVFQKTGRSTPPLG